jgi:hypothetical protein
MAVVSLLKPSLSRRVAPWRRGGFGSETATRTRNGFKNIKRPLGLLESPLDIVVFRGGDKGVVRGLGSVIT